MRKLVHKFRIRPLRQYASLGVQWAISHCPRRVHNYFDRQRSLITRLLPRRVKELLKTIVRNGRPNISLRRQLDQFLACEAAGNPSGRIFLIFSATTFTESEGQRPTRFARELSQRGIPIIFAYWRWDQTAAVQVSHYPHVFCLPIDEFLKYYEPLLADAKLNSLKRAFLIEFPHPCLLEIVNYANAFGWKTIYDVIDDWEEFHKQGQAVWYDGDFETYLLQNADVATITQDNLLEKMTALGARRTCLLPNAFEDWRIPGENAPPPIRKGRITIGYFGHLTASWVDWGLIATVAKRRPDWVFHIIGYGMDKRTARLKNVLFLDRIEHGDLPAYAKNWDVAMIPFQQSKLSAAVDPIKIYEYISLGLPTVATGIPHLASYPGVFMARDHLEFESAVEKASKTGIDKAEAERFLSVNRWSNRVDDLLKILDEEKYKSAVSLSLMNRELLADRAAA